MILCLRQRWRSEQKNHFKIVLGGICCVKLRQASSSHTISMLRTRFLVCLAAIHLKAIFHSILVGVCSHFIFL